MKSIAKSILVPIDFSPASDRALELAGDLAGPFKADVHLVHVRTSVDTPVVSPDDLEEVERILALSDAKTEKTLEKASQGIDSPTHCHVQRGASPADAIIDAVSQHGCDLVVMGTNGRRGLKGLIVGSVAKEVVHRSPVPVLTTRAETARDFPPKRILVAYDSSKPSLQAVLLAAEWARLLAAEITLLHAMEPITYPDFYAHYTFRENQMKRLSQTCHAALAEIGAEHLDGVRHDTAVIHAQAADGISGFASTHGFDLVVLATRGLSGIAHALFGSVAERVTQLCSVPVLTVRESTPPPTAETRKERRFTTYSPRADGMGGDPESFSIARTHNRTVVRFRNREALAGADLRVIDGLWDFLESEARDPKPIVVLIAPPGLLGPANLERLVDGSKNGETLGPAEVRARIIREENVIQRFVKEVRRLDSFVIGAVGGDVALQLAAPLLACDYRIAGPETVFVNTTHTLPRAPLGGLPWLLANLLGGAKATQLLLDVERLTAEDARALGLINQVTDPGRLDEETLKIVDRLGSLPRAALIGLKRSMTASSDDLHSYLTREMELTEQLASPRWVEQ